MLYLAVICDQWPQGMNVASSSPQRLIVSLPKRHLSLRLAIAHGLDINVGEWVLWLKKYELADTVLITIQFTLGLSPVNINICIATSPADQRFRHGVICRFAVAGCGG